MSTRTDASLECEGPLYFTLLDRFREPNNPGNIERSAAQSPLVPTAEDLRLQSHLWGAATNVKSADSFRPVYLVSGETHHIDM